MGKGAFLAISNGYYLFGTTVYMGVMWSLRFFWYPSWGTLTLDNVHDQFILPTSAATRFFTIVVPIMMLSGVILVWHERKNKLIWLALLALLGIVASTLIGWYLIIPVNKSIAAGLATSAILQEHLQRWMTLNTWRWMTITIMWVALVLYFFLKGGLIRKWNGEEV